MSDDDRALMMEEINSLVIYCHTCARERGWWDKERNVGEMLALIHSEISEALEGYRTDARDVHLPHHPSLTVELADALVRIFDLAGGLELDLGGAFADKMAYNMVRADHSREARAAPGGKRI